MLNQKGFIDFDFSKAIIVLLVSGSIVGLVLGEVIRFVWPFVKHMIHMATA